jgi:hypothetical protein
MINSPSDQSSFSSLVEDFKKLSNLEVSDILAKYEKSRSERRLMLSSDEFQAYL